jgi:tetratricopeptide (TPR) repeat protein
MLPALLILAHLAWPAFSQAPSAAFERKAYADANAWNDTDKKIEALENFLKDYPRSALAAAACQTIFIELAQNHPEQTARIQEMAYQAIEKSSDASAKILLCGTMANLLCNSNLMLSDAEKLAHLGMDLLKEESARNSANTANVDRIRAGFQVILGRLYSKQGKLDAAEQNFREALKANPQLAAASLGLAEIYEKRGDSASALNAYLDAAALSRISAGARASLNSLYARIHQGSMAGLEELLDARYRSAYPAPFAVARYQPGAQRSDRVALMEVFTGSGCPPCVAASVAADLIMERFTAKELAVVMYHVHVPLPDPMTLSQNAARFRYYANIGVPTLAIDGILSPVGGGPREMARGIYDRISSEIEKQLTVPANARLKLRAALKGNTVETSVGIDRISGDSRDLKLRILLVEEKVRYLGENGIRIHPMVVRSAAGAQGTGLPVNKRGPQTLTWSFDLPAISAAIKKYLDEYEDGGQRGVKFVFTEKKIEIDPKDLTVVAFLQDDATQAVLQTATIRIQ